MLKFKSTNYDYDSLTNDYETKCSSRKKTNQLDTKILSSITSPITTTTTTTTTTTAAITSTAKSSKQTRTMENTSKSQFNRINSITNDNSILINLIGNLNFCSNLSSSSNLTEKILLKV